MAEAQDVDTLKRRGRRRLVGAVALVLLAVIVLPMVFDPEPRDAAPPVRVRIAGERVMKFTLGPQPATPPCDHQSRMIGLDIAVIVVLLLAIGGGACRGMVHEVLSLAGWVLAFFAANLLTAPLAETFPAAMRPEIRVLVAFLVIFVGTLVVATLATTLFT